MDQELITAPFKAPKTKPHVEQAKQLLEDIKKAQAAFDDYFFSVPTKAETMDLLPLFLTMNKWREMNILQFDMKIMERKAHFDALEAEDEDGNVPAEDRKIGFVH